MAIGVLYRLPSYSTSRCVKKQSLSGKSKVRPAIRAFAVNARTPFVRVELARGHLCQDQPSRPAGGLGPGRPTQVPNSGRLVES